MNFELGFKNVINNDLDCTSLMNMETDNDQASEDKYLLIAKADNVKHISSLLKAVNFQDVRSHLVKFNA